MTCPWRSVAMLAVLVMVGLARPAPPDAVLDDLGVQLQEGDTVARLDTGRVRPQPPRRERPPASQVVLAVPPSMHELPAIDRVVLALRVDPPLPPAREHVLGRPRSRAPPA